MLGQQFIQPFSKVVVNDFIQKAPWKSMQLQYVLKLKIIHVPYLRDRFIVCNLTKNPKDKCQRFNSCPVVFNPFHNIWILIFKTFFFAGVKYLLKERLWQNREDNRTIVGHLLSSICFFLDWVNYSYLKWPPFSKAFLPVFWIPVWFYL